MDCQGNEDNLDKLELLDLQANLGHVDNVDLPGKLEKEVCLVRVDYLDNLDLLDCRVKEEKEDSLVSQGLLDHQEKVDWLDHKV